MRLYLLYVLALASVVIAALALVPNVPDRLRRWLIAAVSLLVVMPAVVAMFFV